LLIKAKIRVLHSGDSSNKGVSHKKKKEYTQEKKRQIVLHKKSKKRCRTR